MRIHTYNGDLFKVMVRSTAGAAGYRVRNVSTNHRPGVFRGSFTSEPKHVNMCVRMYVCVSMLAKEPSQPEHMNMYVCVCICINVGQGA